MKLTLATERLVLRPFHEGDTGAFSDYRSDPEVARYQGWDIPYSLSQAGEFVRQVNETQLSTLGQWHQLAIEPKSVGCIVGDCAFYLLANDPQQAEIGFTIARPYQRQGYASEAVRRLLDYLFEDLNLHRVRANCDAENLASARLMEKVGMRREAHFIENIWFKGRWASEYWYAILKQEWEQLPNQEIEDSKQ